MKLLAVPVLTTKCTTHINFLNATHKVVIFVKMTCITNMDILTLTKTLD